MGLLLSFFLLGLGDLSGLFFLFLVGVDVAEVVLSPSTRLNSVTSEGSTRMGVAEAEKQELSALFPSLFCMWG